MPLRVAAVAAEVIGLADRILAGANVNVISDVAVAASAGRAALESAAINVEINLSAMSDPALRAGIAREISTGWCQRRPWPIGWSRRCETGSAVRNDAADRRAGNRGGDRRRGEGDGGAGAAGASARGGAAV